MLTAAVLPRVLAGRRAAVPADPDAPHTWTGQPARSGAGSPSASAMNSGISRLPEPSVAITT